MGAEAALGPGAKEFIDFSTFSQILEMDDDKGQFSRGIVQNYYEQAEQTMKSMDAALASGDRAELSLLGHFLKGSTASIGLIKVRDTCEDIQNINDGDSDADIQGMLTRLRSEYDDAHGRLIQFFQNYP